MNVSWRTLAVVGLGLLSLVEPARAQDEAAKVEARFGEALRGCQTGHLKEGVDQLTVLYAETQDPQFVAAQGRCYQINGKPDPAIRAYKEYLRVARDATVEDKSRVEGYLKAAEEESKAAAATKADTVVVPVPVPIPVPPPAPPASGMNRLQKTGLIVGGVGIAALGAGAFFSYKVQSTELDVNSVTKGSKVFEASELGDRDRRGAKYELMQWISYAVGLSAVVAGATTFYLGGQRGEPESRVVILPAVGPGVARADMQVSF